MVPLNVSAFSVASKFLGVRETPGALSTPVIVAMLQLDTTWPERDEVPWCSAFVNAVAWLLGLPRSKSLAARSWLHVGTAITLDEAVAANDVVILKRNPQDAGPHVEAAPGHVGFFAGHLGSDDVLLLGGNQGDRVSVTAFSSARILGVRRLWPPPTSVT